MVVCCALKVQFLLLMAAILAIFNAQDESVGWLVLAHGQAGFQLATSLLRPKPHFWFLDPSSKGKKSGHFLAHCLCLIATDHPGPRGGGARAQGLEAGPCSVAT